VLSVLGLLAAAPLACAGASDRAEDADSHDEPIGETSAPLVATDTVATAVAQSCTTTSVKGLATQLVEEIQCLKPGSLTRIDKTPGLSLGAAVFPYLQTPAAQALVAAQKARGTTMTINSALRALPQQYLLYRWYQQGRCGIGLAARPGTSNHESALAVDIEDNAGWRTAMTNKSFRWLGASDPVHYDYVGPGRITLSGLSVLAFQRLWNRNNPTDKIGEDGAYGPATEARLAKSPIGGFPKGADCKDVPDGGMTNPDGGGTEPEDVPVVPDGDEPPPESGAPPAAPGPQAGNLPPTDDRPSAGSGGCSTTPAHGAGAPLAVGAVFVVALSLLRARRRR
jgi:hypothetical protein